MTTTDTARSDAFLRQAEIQNFDMSGLIKPNVLGLEIPIDDTLLMEVPNSFYEFTCHQPNIVLWKLDTFI